MRRTLLMTAALTAITLAGCHKSSDSTAAETGNAAAANGTMAETSPSNGVDAAQDAAAAGTGLASAAAAKTVDSYVPAAAIGDMFEIQSSKLALAKSKSADVRKFAEQMIADHTATTAKLKATLKTANLTVTPPAALDDRRQGMIDALKAASATDFDKLYLDQQTKAHEEALTLHKGYADDGDNPALKTLATGIAPKVEQHLDMVKTLAKGGAA